VTSGGAASCFTFVVVHLFFFLASRGFSFVADEPPLAPGPFGTTAAGNGARGATTPDSRRSG
jgi:hypothetical protein